MVWCQELEQKWRCVYKKDSKRFEGLALAREMLEYMAASAAVPATATAAAVKIKMGSQCSKSLSGVFTGASKALAIAVSSTSSTIPDTLCNFLVSGVRTCFNAELSFFAMFKSIPPAVCAASKPSKARKLCGTKTLRPSSSVYVRVLLFAVSTPNN